jgi:hypothetical protein
MQVPFPGCLFAQKPKWIDFAVFLTAKNVTARSFCPTKQHFLPDFAAQ